MTRVFRTNRFLSCCTGVPLTFTWKAFTLSLLINEDGLPPPRMTLGAAPPSPVDMEAPLQRATELCCRREVHPGEHHLRSACFGGCGKHNSAITLPLAFHLLVESPPGREGLPCWAELGRRAVTYPWARLLPGCAHIRSAAKGRDLLLFASLSSFCVYTELCSSEAFIIIVITTYWILFYAFNIV